MNDAQPSAGYFRSSLPYNRLGHGPRPLVIFQGLTFARTIRRRPPGGDVLFDNFEEV